METQTPTQDTALQTFTIDPAHSQVTFSVRHMGFSKVRGRFQELEGTVHVDPDDVESLEAKATIDADSINTGDEKRDQHLRSDDFFGAEEHPELTFESTEVKDVDGSTFTLVGDLTIRDVTRTVELDAEYLGQAQDPWGNTRVACEAQGTINRKDYGLNWNQVLETGGVLVGEKVDIRLEVQAVQQEEEE